MNPLRLLCLAHTLSVICVFWVAVSSPPGLAKQTEIFLDDELALTDMTLEELMNLEVTSVSKKTQNLSQAAAAVFVITQEDIRRAGATSIPEVLRMVPGVQVARIDANKWAISVRGFNLRFANKLLVLMDGRTLYTPSFSGVFWDVQDTVMEDIDRIEVIRGPGATLWGANAVNGVINIITKQAVDTQGALVSAGGGSDERGFGLLRYGGDIGKGEAYYRVLAKYFKRDGSVETSGRDTADEWEMTRGGFRLDWTGLEQNAFTFQGDYYSGDEGEIVINKSITPSFNTTSQANQDVEGGHVLGRWENTLSESSNLSLQFYYDRNRRKLSFIETQRDTVDIDFQHRFPLGKRHDVIWGGGYRYSTDDFKNISLVHIDPIGQDIDIFSGFIQDDITLIEDYLRLTLGSKFEHNDFSGFEYQPNTRLLWTPSQGQSLWASISRAVRTPSRAEQDFAVVVSVLGDSDPQNPFPLPLVTTINNNKNSESEELLAYELGYRWQTTSALGLDVALFYNDYDKLLTTRQDNLVCRPAGNLPLCLPPFSTHIEMSTTIINGLEGETFGAEIATNWQPLERWRLQGSYAYLNMHLRSKQAGVGTLDFIEGRSPSHQVSVRSLLTLPHNVDLDLWARYIDSLPTIDVDSYVTLDARVAWNPRKDLELSVTGQNLVDSYHQEFLSELGDIPPTEIKRSVYGQIRWLL
jgi:iron complex outermembrane receptor protein